MDVIGDSVIMLDAVPRNLAAARQQLDSMGLQLIDVTEDNRAHIAACLAEHGFGPYHHFWVESWDGEPNGGGPGGSFVVNISRDDPRELVRVPASAGFPYRHLAQRLR